MAQNIVNFPDYIEVVLGSWWTGYMGLYEDDVMTLIKFDDGGTFKWSENGTSIANPSTNRIIMYPRFVGSYSAYFNFGGDTFSVGYAYVSATTTTITQYSFKDLWDAQPICQIDGLSSTAIDYKYELFKSMNVGSEPAAATLWEYLTSGTYGLRWGVYPNLLKNGTAPDAFNTGSFPIYRGPNASGDLVNFSGNIGAGYGYNTSGLFLFEQASDDGLAVNTPLGDYGNGTSATFDIYFRYTPYELDEQYLFSCHDGSNNVLGCRITSDREVQFFARADASYGPSITSTGLLTPGEEYRVTCIYTRSDGFPTDPTIGKIYINGRLDTAETANLDGSHSLNFNTPLDIGNSIYVSNVAPGGNIYYFQYFESDLTTQVANIHSVYDGAIMSGWYGYDDGDGTMSISRTPVVPPAPPIPEPAKKVGSYTPPTQLGTVSKLPNQLRTLNDRRLRQKYIDRVKVLTYR
jgi:hypothetical protein